MKECLLSCVCGGGYKPLALLGVSIALYYGCMAMYKLGPFYCRFQIFSLLPLMTAIYYLFVVCSNKKLLKVFDKPLAGNVIYVISSLTLEIYLVQYAVFTDALNGLFPLNIAIVYLMIFAVAYVLKCLSNLFSIVFAAEDISIKSICKL